jgi:transposase
LAKYAEKGILAPIVVPTEQEEADRHIVRVRDQLMKKQRRVKHQIKSLLLQFSIKEPAGLKNWTIASVATLAELKLMGSIKLSLDILVDELNFLKQQLEKVGVGLKKLSATSRHKEANERLQTHPGVGEVTAMKFLAEIYQPGRFRKPEQVTSYLGLAPKVSQSGETRKEGGIQKSGRQALRSILIEASWTWMRKDHRGKQLYAKLLRNTGSGKKAIVGVARHMAINLWCMLTRQHNYKPAKQGA